MNRLVRAALTVALLAVPASARADGRVVVAWEPTQRAVATSATTPDQRALIIWDEGKETLVIETAFSGAGRDFAWIVPLPAVPTIEASTTGLFPTLDAIAAPEVVHDVAPYWIFCALFGGGVWLIARKREGLQFLGVAAALVGCIHLAYVTVGLPKFDAGRHTKSVLTLGDGGGAAAAEKPVVVVHERRVVGAFETATISSADPKALLDWLATNGYAQEPEIAPVVAQYVAEGWVFVAAKIKREADSDDAVRIHPLAFTFATTKPVYPMRLTGPGNGDCRVELFVAAERRAKSDGFDVDWCGGVVVGNRNAGVFWHRAPEGELKRRLGGDRTVTLLSRTFDESAMTRDVDVGWDETREFRRTRYSAYGAAVTAANFAGFAALFLAGFVWSLDAGRRRGQRVKTTSPWTRWSWAWVAALAFAATWLALPKVDVHVLATDARAERFNLPEAIDGRPPTMHSARTWAAARARGMTNAYAGGDVREEDSPGNYLVREVDGRPMLVWESADGWEYSAMDGGVVTAPAPRRGAAR